MYINFSTYGLFALMPKYVDLRNHQFASRKGGNQTGIVVEQPDGPLAFFEFGASRELVRRILVLKLDHTGDFLIALPALEELRRTFRNARITLICGPWNAELARASGIADEVRPYSFFSAEASQWNGEPVESTDRFREIAAGRFDIAIDMRVDEDTRFLLGHVDAALKCGIGSRNRHPYLDVIMPTQFENRETDTRVTHLAPDRFQSRMPSRTLLYHETDFSITNEHLIYGYDFTLPPGRYRAVWGLWLRAPLRRFGRPRIVVDVARNRGADIVASQPVDWRGSGHAPVGAAVEFTSKNEGGAFEFRLHARGRPLWARLRFYGVWIEPLDKVGASRLKPLELHVGEQLSLLIRLVRERVSPFPEAEWLAGAPEATDPSGATGPGWRPGARRIVIAPVSNSEVRDWSIESYSKLVAMLLSAEDCVIALLGSAGQRDLLDRIAGEHRDADAIVNLAGRTTWLQSAAILREADLVISNNSGVGHLAAACGAPLLAIYSASHEPQEWGPRGNKTRVMTALVPCARCGYERLEHCPNDHACMRMITPEAVAEQARAMLAGVPRR